MPARKARAMWHGSFKDGHGHMSIGEGAFEGDYSAFSRFEDEQGGTNPEELLGAAHAGCFSMSLAAGLSKAGTPPNHIQTTADVTLERTDAGWTVTKIQLTTEADVPGVDQAGFQAAAEHAKNNCPISRALKSVPAINLTATLLSEANS